MEARLPPFSGNDDVTPRLCALALQAPDYAMLIMGGNNPLLYHIPDSCAVVQQGRERLVLENLACLFFGLSQRYFTITATQ